MAETASSLPTDLLEQLAVLAQVPQLLVATDYDGTIAPIVNDPMRAVPDREAAVALRTLATLDQTHVGVISSRALRDLAALSRDQVNVLKHAQVTAGFQQVGTNGNGLHAGSQEIC